MEREQAGQRGSPWATCSGISLHLPPLAPESDSIVVTGERLCCAVPCLSGGGSALAREDEDGIASHDYVPRRCASLEHAHDTLVTTQRQHAQRHTRWQRQPSFMRPDWQDVSTDLGGGNLAA